MFFDSEEEEEVFSRRQNDGKNLFNLSEEEKNNLNKRLPRGFTLVKKCDLLKLKTSKTPLEPVEIQFVPVKKEKRIASKELQDSLNLLNPISQGPQGRTRGLMPTMEGKSRQMEKIKNIIQKFRKHPKYTTLANYLGKIGLLQAVNDVQTENRRNLLTIETFKDRYRLILDSAKNTATHVPTIELIDDMIEEFLMYVEQARKAEFQNNIQSIQKSVDKITRHISQVKTQGNWYIKKKKKGQKSYTEAEMLHLSDLINSLPEPYLVGIWEIIQERPFSQTYSESLSFNLLQIGNKKLKQIQTYTKTKLLTLYKSRKRKKDKIEIKRIKREEKMQEVQMEEKEKEDMVSGEIFRQSKPFEQLQDIFMKDNDSHEVKEEHTVKKEAESQSEDSMNEDDSSDSSMITDEEDSQF